MPVDARELIEAISIIANEENVRVTIAQAGKGALICAASAFIGGLLMGPRGLALGGAVGGVAAYATTDGTFRSLADVLRNDLTSRQKQMLVRSVTNAVASIGPSDVKLLLPLITRDSNVKKTVLNAAINFVNKELNLQVVPF